MKWKKKNTHSTLSVDSWSGFLKINSPKDDHDYCHVMFSMSVCDVMNGMCDRSQLNHELFLFVLLFIG